MSWQATEANQKLSQTHSTQLQGNNLKNQLQTTNEAFQNKATI